MIDERSWARFRWRCRRGLLELDLVLARFLDKVAGGIDEQDLIALDQLLDLPDNELWDLVSGRTEPSDERCRVW